MASNSETGHAKNIANLKALNEINAGFGGTYNPSNPLLVLATMVAQQTTCEGLQNAVNAQNGSFKPLVNLRQQLFREAKATVRRVRSAAKSCGASAEWVADVNSVVNKILGVRVSKATPTADDPAGTSASQQSYDNVLNFMDQLAELLKNEPMYVPNEVDLQIVTIEAGIVGLNNANNAVKAGRVPYNTAIIARNRALYEEATGLVDVAQASKDYVRSLYGYSSPEFRLVSAIKFKKMVDVD